MREEAQFARAIERILEAKATPVVATVVGIEGSSYRREGARLVIDPDGNFTGVISGGCLEPEVARVATSVRDSGHPQRRYFDLRDDSIWGLGLGCGGAIDVWIEPVYQDDQWSAWLRALTDGRPAVRAFLMQKDQEPNTQIQSLVLVGNCKPVSNLENARLEDEISALAQDLLEEAQSRSFSTVIRETEVFFDLNAVPWKLFIFGAGDDARPVAALGRQLGFRVTVVDPRPAFLTPERFRDMRLLKLHPKEFDGLNLDSKTFVITMNHNLQRDRAALGFVLESPAPYIGVLGPRSRFERLLQDLKEEGFSPSQARLEKVYSPIGLDLGAEHPDEIAVSILAEILAVRNRFSAGFLRDREGEIHQPGPQPPLIRS